MDVRAASGGRAACSTSPAPSLAPWAPPRHSLSHSTSISCSQRAAPGRHAVRAAAFGKFFKEFFNFDANNWGPKSTRIWRQQQYGWESSTSSGSDDDESPAGGPAGSPAAPGAPPPVDANDVVSGLQARISSMPSSSRPSLDAGAGDDDDPRRSFSDAADDELSAALSQRIGQIASASSSYDTSSLSEEEMRVPMNAEELRRIIYTKYGKTYDVSFVRRDVPGRSWVAMNIMWNHLEQRSFNLTEEQYMEKLDGVAYLLTALGQADKVRAFMKEPPRSQKGMPPRPVVGTAINIRLDLDQGVVDEWFGKGYQ